MRLAITGMLLALLALGCTTVKYNGSPTVVTQLDHPLVGQIVTAQVGDHMVQKGIMVEEEVLVVHDPIDGANYDIPARTYRRIGFDEKEDFYTPDGVTRGAFADPVKALALGREPGSELCVVTAFGIKSCYEGNYSRATVTSEKTLSFQQTLIYSGRIGDKINIGYREFSNDIARPAFNNDVEYDLGASMTLGYKGALIEIMEADNTSITYKLLRNFQ